MSRNEFQSIVQEIIETLKKELQNPANRIVDADDCDDPCILSSFEAYLDDNVVTFQLFMLALNFPGLIFNSFCSGFVIKIKNWDHYIHFNNDEKDNLAIWKEEQR